VVTVALDIRPADTYKWIDAASPAHPSLIDTRHVTGELFGFTNIPMAVWIDESGVIVRNAESASIERSPLRNMEVPEGIPDRMRTMLTEVKAIPDHAQAYRDAVLDWVAKGAESVHALDPEEVIARSQPRSQDTARATACFELGQHLHEHHAEDPSAAIDWWKRAHDLDRSNWTYKRQAWTLATTPEDAEDNDLAQEATEIYGTSWIDDVIAGGGGAAYVVEPQLGA
jgi:hypothetical protein